MTGKVDRATDEWREAYRVATDAVDSGREQCLAAVSIGFSSLAGNAVAGGLEWAELGVEQSRTQALDWPLALGSTVSGMLNALAGDVEAAAARFSSALEIQERHGDREGAGLSLGGLAQLAASRGEISEALELYRRSLASFEAIGDRAEEARILSEMGWTCLESGDTAAARRNFFEAVQAHSDVASVRGVGLSLVGLAAADTVEHRPERAVQIAAAAEVYAEGEGILVVYSDETPGRELVGQARAALSADELVHATEIGRRLTIDEALELARGSRSAVAG